MAFFLRHKRLAGLGTVAPFLLFFVGWWLALAIAGTEYAMSEFGVFILFGAGASVVVGFLILLVGLVWSPALRQHESDRRVQFAEAQKRLIDECPLEITPLKNVADLFGETPLRRIARVKIRNRSNRLVESVCVRLTNIDWPTGGRLSPGFGSDEFEYDQVPMPWSESSQQFMDIPARANRTVHIAESVIGDNENSIAITPLGRPRMSCTNIQVVKVTLETEWKSQIRPVAKDFGVRLNQEGDGPSLMDLKIADWGVVGDEWTASTKSQQPSID